jgi:hypothetical protein
MADTNFDPDPKRVRSLTIGLKRFLGGRIKKGGKGVSEKDEKEKGGSDSWSAEQWHETITQITTDVWKNEKKSVGSFFSNPCNRRAKVFFQSSDKYFFTIFKYHIRT